MGCPSCGQKYRPPAANPPPGQQQVTVNPNRRVSVNGVIRAPVNTVPKPTPPQS